MPFCGVRKKAIDECDELKPSTVSNIIRRERVRRASNGLVKKRGQMQKLSPRSLRLFRKYVVRNCFEPLFVIVARFSADVKILLSESTGR